MAALDFGGQFAVAATATKLTTALSLTERRYAKRLTVKNAAGAANTLYIGGSDVTNVPANAHIELAPGQSYDFYSGEGWLVSTEDIYTVGTVNAANIVFVNGMA